MTEDFIQNIQFDLFSVELVIGETATLILAENYVTIREVFVDDVKVEPNEAKQIFLQSGVSSHPSLTDKNAEADFLHATQAQHDRWDDTYTKSEVEQIKLELLNLIYAGL